jgi:hypothetical protein
MDERGMKARLTVVSSRICFDERNEIQTVTHDCGFLGRKLFSGILRQNSAVCVSSTTYTIETTSSP